MLQLLSHGLHHRSISSASVPHARQAPQSNKAAHTKVPKRENIFRVCLAEITENTLQKSWWMAEQRDPLRPCPGCTAVSPGRLRAPCGRCAAGGSCRARPRPGEPAEGRGTPASAAGPAGTGVPTRAPGPPCSPRRAERPGPAPPPARPPAPWRLFPATNTPQKRPPRPELRTAPAQSRPF